MACGIPLIRSANGNRNRIPLNRIPFNRIPFPFISVKKIFESSSPFVSVKTNFESAVKFPFPLAAACFYPPLRKVKFRLCGLRTETDRNSVNGIPFPFVSVKQIFESSVSVRFR